MKMKMMILVMCAVLHSPCQADPLPVIASIFPLADLVQQVGGEHVSVVTVIPPGASPHAFEPSPGLVRKITSARIFFKVGAGLEFWWEKFVRNAAIRPVEVVLSDGVDLIQAAGHSHHEDMEAAGHLFGEHHAGEHQEGNPHVWLDPVIAAGMVSKIADSLSLADPVHADFYQNRRQRCLSELAALDRDIRAAVSRFSSRWYISAHSAWDYFARRYGLQSAGAIEASPGRQPVPREIAALVSRIKAHQIRAVFAEPQLNSQLAALVAREAGIPVVFLDPVGDPHSEDRNTYIRLMRTNLRTLQEVMQ